MVWFETLLGMKSCNFFVLLNFLILNFYIYSLLLLIYIVLKQFNEFDDHSHNLIALTQNQIQLREQKVLNLLNELNN